jgi:hypothetical protein
MKEKTFIDSNIIFYCSGDIGYRWAVKVTQEVAKNGDNIYADVFLFQEILDRFYYLNDPDRAEYMYNATRGLLTNVVEVTVDDFDRSFELHQKYPHLQPRLLLHIGVMTNNNSEKIISTYSADVEEIEEVKRINLMENIKI